MRLRGLLALLCALTIGGGITAAVTRDTTRIEMPALRIEPTADGYTLHWSNPSHGYDYAPLRFGITVLTKDLLIQQSFFPPEERTTEPGCCHISLRAGADGTTFLPRMRLPVSGIGFVVVQAGDFQRGPHFPDIWCPFSSGGRVTCQPVPED